MLCFVVRWGGIGRYYILDVEPILYFLVGLGEVGLRRLYSLVLHVWWILQFGITCFFVVWWI